MNHESVRATAPRPTAFYSTRHERRYEAPQPRGHRRDGARAGSGHAPSSRHDRRRLVQASSGGRVVMERGDAVQSPTGSTCEAGRRGCARRARVPVRVRNDRGERRHLDGTRRNARIAREPRGHRRLGRSDDARRTIRRDGDAGGVRQVVARDVDGRGADKPSVGISLRWHDSSRAAG
jgi:hypothetical protein